MPSHQALAQAQNNQERLDIKMNNLADKLAKKGAKMSTQTAHPEEPWSIYIAGGDAPTPAKKWTKRMTSIGLHGSR